MADYYPLIARAVDGLPEADADARRAVYERARAALTTQLRSVQPSLAEAEIGRELSSLDDAIARAEEINGGRRGAEGGRISPVAPTPASVSDFDEPRDRAERTPPIRRGGKRGRSLVTAFIILAVIVPLAALAWLWRDRPALVERRAEAPPTAPVSPPAEPKDPERVGGSPAPRTPPTSAPSPVPTRPATPVPAASPPAAVPAGPDIPVAQRAALVEENSADPQGQPKTATGRVVWRLDAVNAGQGQQLETVIRASVEVVEAGMTLEMRLRQNRDPTLAASHMIELTFTTPRTGANPRVVKDVSTPNMRSEDGSRPLQLVGIALPVKENGFVIVLSNLSGEVDRNLDFLQRGGWLEIPIRFDNGQRAAIIVEKGPSGDRVLADALKQWSRP